MCTRSKWLDVLNAEGHSTSQGKPFHKVQVKRILNRQGLYSGAYSYAASRSRESTYRLSDEGGWHKVACGKGRQPTPDKPKRRKPDPKGPSHPADAGDFLPRAGAPAMTEEARPAN
jgi:hypothetical protein